MRCMADVKSRPLGWLWPGRIPLGGLTTIAGDPGLGKSFLTLDLAACVSAGRPWPDAPEGITPPGEVVTSSAEDELDTIVGPRLIAAGALSSGGWADPGDGLPGGRGDGLTCPRI